MLLIIMIASLICSTYSREIDTTTFINDNHSYKDLIPCFNKIINEELRVCVEDSKLNVETSCFLHLNNVECKLLKCNPYPKYTVTNTKHMKNPIFTSALKVLWFVDYVKVGQIFPVKFDDEPETYYIGYDKLTHLFDTGYHLYLLGNRVSSYYNTFSEVYHYGLASSLTYSNADLYANLVGVEFWNDLKGRYRCDKWGINCVLHTEVNVKDYLSPYMDESVNINYTPFFYNQTTTRVVPKVPPKYPEVVKMNL